MSSSVGGLGRGLAAILTGPRESADDSLRNRFIESALTSLNAERSLPLSGYVHQIGDDVSVSLRSPELRSLHPTQAYQLFSAVASVADGALGSHSFAVGEIRAMAVVTAGDHSRGVFFFGDSSLEPEAAERLARFCDVYAPVIHDHDRPVSDNERVHLVLDQHTGDAHAEITVDGRVGFGSAATAHEAVAQAALTAVAENAKLVEVREVRGGDGTSAFVVAAGEMGRLATGAASVVAGPDVAAAVAAIRAARALSD